MSESRLVIDEKKIGYKGLINVKGLYREAKEFLDSNAYDSFESYNEEQVYEDGKQIILHLDGEKKLSDYAKIQWKTKFFFENLEDVDVEKEGKKLNISKGKVKLETSVFVVTDYDKSFSQNAFQYFLRIVIDKFIFKNYLNRSMDTAKKHYAKYEEKLKKYLNMEMFK